MISEKRLREYEKHVDASDPRISISGIYYSFYDFSFSKRAISEIRRQRRIIKALKKLVERLKDAQFTCK